MAADKKFLVHSPTTDVDEFRAIAEAMIPLKEHGRILVNISEVADKAWHLIPDVISPWHEYASRNPSLVNSFPHEKIAPHLPADWVKANRGLLMAKADILEELDLGAYFWSYEPNILPESFFRENPHLRGGRVDHPRRGNEEAFAPCVDLQETQDMIASMMAELKKNVPHMEAFSFKTNDAGPGLCWASAQYPGPNGPRHCQNRNPGERVGDMIKAFHRGAEQGGGPIDVYLGNSNFWNNESYAIVHHVPERTYVSGRHRFAMSVGSQLGGMYPVRGLVDSLRIITSMGQFTDPAIHTVFMDFRASYDRGYETGDTIARVVAIVKDCIERPVKGLLPRLERLREWSAKWGGEENADRLMQAFHTMNDAFRVQGLVAPMFRPRVCAAGLRYMVRPLVIKPDLLSSDEEDYFLPHVFNVRLDEARMDYIDMAGGRMVADPAVRNRVHAALRPALSAARTFEGLADAPEGEWLARQALRLRVWASCLRSSANFYVAQMIRDRNQELLNGPERVPPKVGSTTGHPDNLPWNEVMRDELDNACELAGMLKDGGLEMVVHTDDVKYEDTFVLGPDLLDQVNKKIDIMRAHWRDVERWLEPPHK